MRGKTVSAALVTGAALAATFTFSAAQQPQIPTLQASNKTEAKGRAVVFLDRRKDMAHAGVFSLDLKLSFDPAAADYPTLTGPSAIHVDLTDSVQGVVRLADVDQATSTGKHTPTVYLAGRCRVEPRDGEPITGCRYWLMVADNRQQQNREGTPDVIGFLVFDKAGKRIAYGTGPVRDGDVEIEPTPN